MLREFELSEEEEGRKELTDFTDFEKQLNLTEI